MQRFPIPSSETDLDQASGSGNRQQPTPKIWGTTALLYRDERVELTRIRARLVGYSSRHLHRAKDNTFLVERGCLLVLQEENARSVKQIVTPGSGMFTVDAGVWHRFIALAEDTVAYELYRAVDGSQIDPSDIVRADQGGIMGETHDGSDTNY